jgi:predicted DNA-binding transcriptional regulator AlpA
VPHEKTLKRKIDVAKSFGVSLRTIERWTEDRALKFPQPIRINNRCYFDSDAIEAWKAARFLAAPSEAA